MSDASPPRQEFEFNVTTVQDGKIKVKFLDRITVDDIFLHLVNQETFRILTNIDPGNDVDPLFIEYLLKQRFVER